MARTRLRRMVCSALTAATVTATIVIGTGYDQGFDLVIYSLLTLVLVAGGLMILSRQPGHGVGRLLLGFGGWLAVTEFADSYGAHATLPGSEYFAWLSSWSWVGELTFWALILLTFPDGRPLPGLWRRVPPVLLGGAALSALGYGLGLDEQAENFPTGVNPLAVDALPAATLFDIGMPLVMLATAAAIASLVVRLRRSTGIERLQLKWFVVAGTVVGLLTPFGVIAWNATVIAQISMGLGFLMLPVAASVAILRYRLYDIDVVINRALVYTALTVALAAIYLGMVLLLQLVLPARSDLAVAGSTLAVAALFGPARRRIQATVDRRFFRSRYDAGRTLAAFGTRLRDEVSLDTVAAELRSATTETMHPAHISLWIREGRL